MRQLRLLVLLAASIAMGAGWAAGEDKVYRYTDANGVVHYTDKPPSKEAKPVALPGLQTFKHTTPEGKAQIAAMSAKPQFSLAINSPTPDETYHDVSGTITVSVTILPALVSGYQLLYAVDGAPQGALSAETSRALTGLERGTHTISVSLIAPSGEQVASNSTTIHLMQPAAKAAAAPSK